MRVVSVIVSLGRGGSEGQLVELLSRIHPDPVAATVATVVPDAEKRYLQRLRACGVARKVLAACGLRDRVR
jgi:hypothetical protein